MCVCVTDSRNADGNSAWLLSTRAKNVWRARVQARDRTAIDIDAGCLHCGVRILVRHHTDCVDVVRDAIAAFAAAASVADAGRQQRIIKQTVRYCVVMRSLVVRTSCVVVVRIGALRKT